MLQDPWPLRILAWRLRRQAACSAAVICLACSASPITLNTHHAYEDFTSLERVHWWGSLLQGRVFRGGYCSLWLQVQRAAVCLVPAVLLPLLQSPWWPGYWPAHQAAAVSGPAGCSACVVCSTATLCTTLSRQAVSTPCTLTSIFRKLGARLLSGCIPQLKIFYRKISHTFTYCQNDNDK